MITLLAILGGIRVCIWAIDIFLADEEEDILLKRFKLLTIDRQRIAVKAGEDA